MPAPIPTPSGSHWKGGVDQYSEVVDAALWYAEVITAARVASTAHTEAEATVRLAEAEAIDAHNADWEAHINAPTETGTCMGFTAGHKEDGPVDLDASARAAAFAKMGFEHARAEVIRTEVYAVKARREAEAAEANLLTVAADLTPVDRPVEPAASATQPPQPTPVLPVETEVDEEAA
ncbi:uncharacterized protein METZ01_LOCUS269595 [marine metagenome]|uniref:Uncharacterized protein n=1 Tax=marine metagenome TaxID=408172 RepID=A0A382K239_9ZZZZ